MAETTYEMYGRVAWNAYRASCGGVSVRGELLPGWNELSPAIRAHWIAAASAVEVVVPR